MNNPLKISDPNFLVFRLIAGPVRTQNGQMEEMIFENRQHSNVVDTHPDKRGLILALIRLNMRQAMMNYSLPQHLFRVEISPIFQDLLPINLDFSKKKDMKLAGL